MKRKLQKDQFQEPELASRNASDHEVSSSQDGKPSKNNLEISKNFRTLAIVSI
jgi:hypothetical protein